MVRMTERNAKKEVKLLYWTKIEIGKKQEMSKNNARRVKKKYMGFDIVKLLNKYRSVVSGKWSVNVK